MGDGKDAYKTLRKGDMDQGRDMANLLKGRWQIPAAFLAAVTACGVLYSFRPSPIPESPEELITKVVDLAEQGRHDPRILQDATNAAANLLNMDPPLSTVHQAQLHEIIAQTVFDYELGVDSHTRENINAILEHQEQAVDLGMASVSHNAYRKAVINDWKGDFESAAFFYREALANKPSEEDRLASLSRLVVLLQGQATNAGERQKLLFDLLSDENLGVGVVWWGMLQGVKDALSAGNVELAQTFVKTFGSRLDVEEYRGYHEFLQAWMLFAEGLNDEAAVSVFWVEDWAADAALLPRELEDYANLNAFNRWLFAELELAEQRPQTAMDAFENVQGLTTDKSLKTRARIGIGRSLDMLGRYAAAQDVFARVGEALSNSDLLSLEYLDELLATLDRFSTARFEDGDYDPSLDYLELAARIVPESDSVRRLDYYERLGHRFSHSIAAGADGMSKGEYHRAAGRYYEKAVELAIQDSERYYAMLWAAAQQYDEAGLVHDARRNLIKFAEAVNEDARMPQSLLNIGEGFEVEGKYDDALYWYDRLIKAFPNLEEAARARVYSADCLVALGEDRFDDAEAMLESLLTGDVVKPDAEVFRKAYLRLSDLLYNRGQYSDAISRLQTFLRLYPDDPEMPRVLFVLAETYRRSASDLETKVDLSPEGQRTATEMRRRYGEAAGLYEDFLRLTEDQSIEAGEFESFVRLAMFNRGDCLVRLNNESSLEEALITYQQAAARYELEPISLVAQVQLANTHLRLGEHEEAARAVERGRWLLANIPDEAFETKGDGTDRAHWDKYLTAVATSHLFRDVLSSRQ